MKSSAPYGYLVAALAASPLLSSSSPVSKRELGGVLMCNGANATGPCHYQVWQLDVCHQLPDAFYQDVNTFLVDGDGFVCFPRLYDCGGICRSPTGCTFGAVGFDYENRYNLSAIGWDRLFRSFDCYELLGETGEGETSTEGEEGDEDEDGVVDDAEKC